jgi:glycine betaine catabolism B
VITTKIIKSSFKLALNKLKPGDKISAFGPLGYFDFNPNNNQPNIFLAGGIGITPFHSIIRTLYAKKDYPKHIITPFASFTSKDEVIFFDEFKEIERLNTAFEVIYTLTKDNNPRFEKGRINEDLIKRHSRVYKDANYFITGSLEMVDSLYNLVMDMGIPEKNIFKENFPGY